MESVMKGRALAAVVGCAAFVLVTAGPASAGPAQQSQQGQQTQQEPRGFGGPKSMAGELERDNPPEFRVPIRILRSWYEWKNRVTETYGIQFNINYAAVFASASAGYADAGSLASGSGNLTGTFGWEVFSTGGNTGAFGVKFDVKHSIASAVTPMFFGTNKTGFFSLPATGFRDFTPRFTELTWLQTFSDRRFQYVFGKVDPGNYFTYHALVSSATDFLGYGYSINGVFAWPDPGWGVAGHGRFTDNLYATAGLFDARGDVYNDGELFNTGEHFWDGRFFKLIEVGWVPSFDERYAKKISLTYSHTDAYESLEASGDLIESPAGQGVSLTAHWTFNDKLIPFFTFGKGDGKGFNTFYRTSLSVGNGFKVHRNDILGVGFNWAQPGDKSLRDQLAPEIYYRFMVTEHLAFTPDLQFVFRPALNPDKDFILHFVMRMRATF
jgi:porin